MAWRVLIPEADASDSVKPGSESEEAPAATGFFRNSPLRLPRFRRFYFGAVGTALGFTMMVTMAAWLMATLTPSVLMVALVQTAATVPTLLFGLFAGALADIIDRTRVIRYSQVVLLLATLVLAVVTLSNLLNPYLLLLFTFIVGTGFAFYLPAQLSSVNELVSQEELPRAVALNAVAFNVSRAVGPALAGAIATWQGSGSSLLTSALFLTFMLVALIGWQSNQRPPGVPEKLLSGVKSGLRYTRHSTQMRSLIGRTLTFSICASALWALLPVIARDQLGLGAGGYGMIFGLFGTGAVIAALFMPRQLQHMTLNAVVTSNVLLWTVSTLLVASSTITAVAMVGAFGAGAAWVGVLASLGAGTQSSAPSWVRARAVSISLMAVQASLAIGSALWGWLANWTGTQVTLVTSAILLMVLHLLYRKVQVRLGNEADVTSFGSLPEMALTAEPNADDGPVLVQLEYTIVPEDREDFLKKIKLVEPTRRRNGATDWRVFRDLSTEGRFVERFIITSWAEYIRSRVRMTVADRRIQNEVAEMQKSDTPIRISRFLGV